MTTVKTDDMHYENYDSPPLTLTSSCLRAFHRTHHRSDRDIVEAMKEVAGTGKGD